MYILNEWFIYDWPNYYCAIGAQYVDVCYNAQIKTEIKIDYNDPGRRE